MTSDNWHLVFVYGTLMRKADSIRSLDKFGSDAEFVSNTMTSSRSFDMLDLGHFPGVIDKMSGNRVAGELWRVTSDVFKQLDIIEGYPDFYTRKMVPTEHGIAWMYYLPENASSYGTPITENQGVVSWFDSLPQYA